MREYKVKSAGAKHFSLTTAGREIGKLQYKKWFSFKAQIILENNTTYQIDPKGFWGTTMELTQYGKILLHFKMNWKGNIIIKTRFDETGRDFIFKHKGFWKSSFVLLNEDGQELLVIQPEFKWNKCNYDYTISATDNFDKFDFPEILLLTTIHCSNYNMAMASTVVIGAG